VLDAGFVDGNDERRGSGRAFVSVFTAFGCVDKRLAVLRNAHFEEEYGEDVDD